jgi:D-alanyl-D-alanine carboxypeptidase
MNQAAQQLGMTQTSYVNPNGLPADGQITSARDLAILARGIIHDLPEYEYFVHIPSIRYGRKITQNFNKLIGRYPGADGFKTGFICASGYNLVASATRNGKRLIAVVLGASSGQMRAVRATQLLERGFANNTLTWLRPSLGTVDNLVPIDASPPNLHDEMCSGKRHKPASDEDEDTVASGAAPGENGLTFFAAGLQPPMLKPSELLAGPAAASEPIPVYTGPTRTGAALIAAVAADVEKQAAQPHGKKKSHLAAKKPDAAAEASAGAKDTGKNTDADAKSAPKAAEPKSAAKPAAMRHANAKPDTAPKTAETPVAATDKPAAKPAKPKAAAKPPAKPADQKADAPHT